MMISKKRLMSIIAGTAVLAMLAGCGAAPEAAPAEPESAAVEETAKEAPEAETDEDAIAAAEEEELESKNVLAVKAPGYSGLENLKMENNDDGTYYYEDMTEDGITIITNMSYRNSQRDGQAMDAYAENFVCALVDNDARITASAEDTELSEKLTYPVYKVDWESGENEDTRQAVGVVILTDNFTFYFGYECPIDFYEDNEEFYAEELKNVELIDLEALEASDDSSDVKRGLDDFSDYEVDPDSVLFFVKVAAKDGGVNLRSGPSTDDEILIKMIKNDVVLPVTDGVTYEATGKDWYETYYDGEWGFVAESEVDRIEEEDVDPEDIMFFLEIASKDGNANIREEDGTESDVLFSKVKNGTVLYCIDGATREDNGKVWLKVIYQGEMGWISESQIKYLDFDRNVFY